MKSKESLRNELLRYADFVWEASNNHLHPLAQLMVEELCSEMHLLGCRIDSLPQSLLDGLVENLTPASYHYLRCAHAVVCLFPQTPFHLLEKETNFYLKEIPLTSSYKKQEKTTFTPAIDVPLSSSTVTNMFFDRTLWNVDTLGNKTIAMQTEQQGKYNTLWIGLHISDVIETLENLCFYIRFPHLDDSHEYYDRLSDIRWSVGSKVLDVQQGFPVLGNKMLNETEKEVLDYYKDHFQTIKSKVQTAELSKEKMPVELQEILDAGSMLPSFWLSITFPPHFAAEDIEKINISLNTFPVINRGYRRHTISDLEGSQVISLPMGTDESLLDIEEVIDSKKQQYRRADNNRKEKTYSVQNRELAVNEAGLSGYLEQLLDMIQYERHAFPNINEEKIDTALNAISILIGTDTAKTDRNRMNDTQAVLELTVNMSETENSVTVSYWTGSGELANGIPAQSKLMAHKTSELNNTDATFITTVSGGRNFYNIESLKAINRFYINSRGRVLTKMDILNLCRVEIGSYIESIEAVRSVDVSRKFGEGLVNVIEIRIKSLPAYTDFLTTSGILKDLRLRLERISPEGFRYMIILDS